ncbi:DNA-binding protein [Paenibacillus albidus]|uniref:DNA-binding protein n=1 Tax=Paenibacillus albidus TaxID=2041023 RepID=UPI001BE64331|nr:DNA-binding protein [Paenibacillus albidus]MBT2289288.1 DNA-binding protein [Paenibacillus albidus]
MRPSILKSLKPDVIVEMLEMAFRLENWDKMIETADILYDCVQCIYQERQYRKAKELPLLLLELERPLVYYYGFSHLMRGMAHQERGQYVESRACIDKYAELGWLEDLGEEGLEVVEEFRFVAQANGYALDLISGRVGVLDAYAEFLRENPEEVLLGLDTIVRAALRHGRDVDDLIAAFAEQTAEFGMYEDEGNLVHYYHYSYHMALYQKRAGRQGEALELVLRALRLAHQSGHDGHFKRSLALFESLREWAAGEQVREVQEILRGGLEEVSDSFPRMLDDNVYDSHSIQH